MAATVLVPVEWIRSVAELSFPSAVDDRLQTLMDGNNEGSLNPEEFAELEKLVDWNDLFSLLKARARILLMEAEGCQR